MRTLEPGERPKANGKAVLQAGPSPDRQATPLDGRRAPGVSGAEEAQPEKSVKSAPAKASRVDWEKIAFWLFLACLVLASLLIAYQLWGKIHSP